MELVSECLIADVGTFNDGYPIKNIRGRKVRLHRQVLEQKLGRKILPGMCALHKCHIRACINLDHLYEGSHRDNMDDMKSSGHSYRCGSPRKLDLIQVAEIRNRLTLGEGGSSLAREFGVSPSTISRIKAGQSYLCTGTGRVV